ncbi:26S proteasome subunit beta-1 [Acrasis kona]|uniref:Proteasome subunit beta n=1 Tax=Acrasis kona TaxID=1008807 RepID=A0AAW2YP99_9EUKA
MTTHISPQMASSGTQHGKFEPYVNNGGTTLAIPGKDFVIAAGDTRLSTGYSIHTRQSSKVFQLTDKCVIVTAGMQSDASTLHKTMHARLVHYEHAHGKQMSTEAIGQMLSNMLYGRRFFPYYTFNLVAGIDSKGQGVVYGYDAIGSYQSVEVGAMGTGQSLIQPLLDNQVAYKNHQLVPSKELDLERALSLVKDSFTSAGERDIYTGDSVEIAIITQEGIKYETLQLKQD